VLSFFAPFHCTAPSAADMHTYGFSTFRCCVTGASSCMPFWCIHPFVLLLRYFVACLLRCFEGLCSFLCLAALFLSLLLLLLPPCSFLFALLIWASRRCSVAAETAINLLLLVTSLLSLSWRNHDRLACLYGDSGASGSLCLGVFYFARLSPCQICSLSSCAEGRHTQSPCSRHSIHQSTSNASTLPTISPAQSDDRP